MSIMFGGVPPFSCKHTDSAWRRRAAAVAGIVAFRGFTAARSPRRCLGGTRKPAESEGLAGR